MSKNLRSFADMMVPPLEPGPRAEYSEAEFVRIIRMAAELQDRSVGRATSQKLTLAEIEQIAAEVGIAPQHVAEAAVLVATEAGDQWRSWLKVPVQGRLSRAMPGSVSDDGWQEVAAAIRQTLECTGQHSYLPGAFEWVHTDDLSVVRVEVSSLRDFCHVHVSADHRQAAALYLITGPVLGACAALIPLAAFGWGAPAEPWLFVSGAAAAGFAAGWASLKARSTRWERRLRGMLQSLAECGGSTNIKE